MCGKTDIKMPYMDGLTLSRKLKELYRTVKIIIFSGFDEFEYAKEAIQIEVEEYILKPIDAGNLREVFGRIPKEEWPGVVGIDGTDAGLDAVRNEEMLGTVYNDKDGQAQEMLNLAFAIATNGTKENIPLIDGKYVRTPYHKVTQDNIEDYENKQGAVD